MKLYSLLKNINCRVLGNTVVEIKGLYHKDTEVKENGLFFCVRGTRVDGNAFVLSAIKNGAVAIVTENEIPNLPKITQVVVKNAREAMSLIASKFFGNPSSKLKMIGVTGTNGKTTITHMISAVLEKAGKKTAIIGTNGVMFGGKKYDTGMTTPDPIELQKYLALMLKQKIEFVCMEVSAHAVHLNKIDGITFEQVVFTNLTQDHLDFFKTMENYFLSKAKLFTKKHTKQAVINIDDDYGKRLLSGINLNAKTYAIGNTADVFAIGLKSTSYGQSFVLNGQKTVELNMIGRFNVSNALASICVLKNFGISEEIIFDSLKNFEGVSGRFNAFLVKNKTVIIDYAHTPDGLSNVLLACREIAGQNKVVSVFGCGGNREVQKRKIMGEISSKLADFTVITSDNPRFEKREQIASDIECGTLNKNYLVELERSVAIKKAIELAGDGDVVLIAGKGAENYIDENGTKIPYSDFEEIEKIRRSWWGNIVCFCNV